MADSVDNDVCSFGNSISTSASGLKQIDLAQTNHHHHHQQQQKRQPSQQKQKQHKHRQHAHQQHDDDDRINKPISISTDVSRWNVLVLSSLPSIHWICFFSWIL